MDANKIIEAAARFAKEGGQQQTQPQVIQPQPSPMSLQLANMTAQDGNKYVVVIIHHPLGQSVFHFTPESIEGVADAMKDAARLARTGLEIPKL